MSFNFIKLENRKYELTPSTSERRGPLLRRGGGGGGGGEDAEAAAAAADGGARRRGYPRRSDAGFGVGSPPLLAMPTR